MEIYLVNMDRSVERLERMARIFDENGLCFTRISAVDGRLLEVDGGHAFPESTGRLYQIGPGEVGCFLSHRKFWQEVVAGQSSFAAVFEDDIHLGEGIRNFLLTDDWVPADADIVKLETTRVKTLFNKREFTRWSGRSVRRLRGTHTGTGGYVVSKQGAAKLLQMSEAFADPVDQFMFNTESLAWAKLVIYQMSPALCIQDMFLNDDVGVPELRSTLANERPAKQHLTMRQKLFKEAVRPVIRFVRWLSSAIHGYEWGRVPFR